MGKRLKVYMEWLDSVGYSPYVWLRGDWHQPLHLLSKLLADHLNKRRPLNSVDDIAFKIGFNAMLQLAEEFLGIPCLITERDLMIQYPNIILAMLIYLICVKHSVDFIDPKSLRNIVAPRLIFEARNGCDAHFPKCASCCEHVFIIERVVVDACVWHRNCFKCVECNAVMRSGGFKKSKRGYECITHAVRRILDVTKAIRSPRPKVAPPNVPPVNTIINKASSIADTSRSFMAPAVSPKLKSSIVKQKPSPPPKPVGLSTFRKDRTTTLTEDVKSSEITSDYEVVSVSSENTGDSGIVMRGQDLLEETSADGYRIVSPTPKNMQSIETELPVPPPRPKRASMLLKFLSESNPAVDSIFSSSALSSNKVSTTPLQLELSTTQVVCFFYFNIICFLILRVRFFAAFSGVI
ncbi:LIM domain protein [Dictyocaulus viviparus]|uniref:LIM domain protein n=1 Tax=Dictyocaulus viviparus TaxID=29172 RepID=A0A0D8XFM1_DICVI|nr:LIM domain protein [Dictyocaulus viviparus]